jgi:ribulose-5-phosphate 4-epimerase/fuculose-1-phosphate aldolase
MDSTMLDQIDDVTVREDASVQKARVELAAVHRLAVLDGLHEGTWNHFTVRHPTRPGRLLMTPPDTHWSQVRASTIIDVGPEFPRFGSSWIAYRIHTPLHEARPDISCVLHVHSPALTAMSMLADCRLRMTDQNALDFYGRVAVTDELDALQEADMRQGEVMAEALGDSCTVLLLRNHGAAVAGPTIAAAYHDLYTLDRTCHAQLMALATGEPLRELSDAQAAQYQERSAVDEQSGGIVDSGGKHLAAMMDVLNATEPDYAS